MTGAWIASTLLAAFTVLLLFGGQPWLAVAPGLLALFTAPLLRGFAKRLTGLEATAWLRAIIIVALAASYFGSYFAGMASQETIFLGKRGERRVMELYDAGLGGWTVDREERWIPTSFGDVHVISAGDPDNPPALLLHASAMGAWSWEPNVETLAKTHRIHAVDIIGEAGKSRLEDLGRFVFSDEDISEVNAEILDALGIERALLVGASAGGHQAMRFASNSPERAAGLILAGPMGLNPPVGSLVTMSLGMLFPVPPVQRATAGWAVGRATVVKEEVWPWFLAVMKGTIGRPTAPRRLTAEELRSIEVPVLLVLGTEDNLVGDPDSAADHAANMPDLRVEILDSGHLVAMERREEFNRLVAEFLAEHPGMGRTP